ncbi:hypothetical protein IUU84_11365 [Kocuria rhizophila]|uniref:hypothetical protein n=1 Tax=Kocuria rhizophila TaxID=72000 RepID=UPI002949F124|nr:hypothetical protein [Kocuria rhizophila]MDV6000160.1 hypothetical protein [Kocuria rhizophila]
MGSRGHFIMGVLFALLGLARFLTGGSPVFGWVYLGVGVAWFLLGWRLKRRENAAAETAEDEAASLPQDPSSLGGDRHSPHDPPGGRRLAYCPLVRLIFEQDRASSQETLLGAVSTEQEAIDFIAKRKAEGTDNRISWIEMPLLDAVDRPVNGDWVYAIVGGTDNVQDEEGNIGPSPRAVFADEKAAQTLYDRQIKENPWSPPYLLKLRLGEIVSIENFGPFREGPC